jgi:hypothetical protein
MAKPILVIRIPPDFNCEGGPLDSSNPEWVKYVRRIRQEYMDYHVFFDPFKSNGVKRIEFECINPDNVPSKDIGQIKKVIKKFKLF